MFPSDITFNSESLNSIVSFYRWRVAAGYVLVKRDYVRQSNRLKRPWLVWVTVATIWGLRWKCFEINPTRNN